MADPDVWSQVHDEGVQIVENIANIRVPMIAAIEGRAQKGYIAAGGYRAKKKTRQALPIHLSPVLPKLSCCLRDSPKTRLTSRALTINRSGAEPM